MKKYIVFAIIMALFFVSCNNSKKNKNEKLPTKKETKIKKVKLDVDLSSLSASQKKMVKLFIKASEYVDSMFFYENFANYQSVLDSLTNSAEINKFKFNFGPWDRFNNNKSFIKNIGKKSLGANFYPSDITKKEFNDFPDSSKNNPYTFIRRNKKGKLYCVDYHQQFKKYIQIITKLMDSAANLSKDKEFAKYLRERTKALQTDSYFKSDSIWIALRKNKLDFIIGPVYILDDEFMNLKAEHQSFVLLKDTSWTAKMETYNKWLKYLQKTIPVPEKYRAEDPGSNSSIEVYNALYFGGSGKSGGAFISVVFPINPKIQMTQGVKNLQFENVMNYKFKYIVAPIADKILVDSQKPYICSDAFFINTLLFEMANSLGIRNTINHKGTVRKALKENFQISDYLKNISLSMFLAEKLFAVGEIKTNLKDNYYTTFIDLIRLIRFGKLNSYAISNRVCYNYFVKNRAITYNDKNNLILNYKKIRDANNKLIKKIIIMQGNGDYQGIKEFIAKYNYVDKHLQVILEGLNKDKIPTDIQFIEGTKELHF